LSFSSHVHSVVFAGFSCVKIASHVLLSSLNGVTTTVFESTPVYPTPSRYWQTVEMHKITQFYTAPTTIRLLRRLGARHVENHDSTPIRTLGSVGEHINTEAWHWHNEHVGKKQCAIVDTFSDLGRVEAQNVVR
jgi:acyl-coenzyme A synthetase/AMP-(fatty) acid ligase